MSNVIRIKRRTSGAAGAPSSLENAELAFNEVDSVLYYGKGTGGAGGTATTIEAIGGPGAFTTLTSTQTISGGKTFTGSVSLGSSATATTKTANDNSTSVATTAYVDGALSTFSSTLDVAADSGTAQSIDLSTETLTISGGTGLSSTTGTNSVSINLDNTTVSAGSYGSASSVGTFTVDAQGRLTAASNVNISITSSAVTDFDTQVRTSRLDQMAAPAGSVDYNNQKITGLADPTQAQDGATKAYVDSVAAGIHTHEAAQLATASGLPSYTYNNGTSGVGATLTGTSNGALSVDSTVVTSGIRILVKDETSTNAPYNGVYVVTTVGDASNPYVLTRATDFDENGELPGSFIFVESGSVNADNGFVCTTDSPVVVGTTDISFTQFSGAGEIIAGDGLTKSGNTLNVGGTANRITVNADTVDIAATYVGQSSITTVGTIGTGVWQGSAVNIAYGGTGATTAGDARTNLGLAIGTDVQAYDAELTTLSGMASGTASALAALTQTEVEVIDGTTTATATTLAATDSFVVNDGGTMVQVALSDLVTFFEDGTASGFDIDGGTY